MQLENSDKKLIDLSDKELLDKKKKVVSHRLNLECRREQLLVLIEKLTSISTERIGFLSAENGQDILSRIFSMGDQLSQAEKNKKKLESEILQAKGQIESLNVILSERKLSDKG